MAAQNPLASLVPGKRDDPGGLSSIKVEVTSGMSRGTKILFALAAVIAAGALLFFWTRRPQSDQLDQDILARSNQYIRTLGDKRLDQLTTEQKLLLLHSQYNVHNYAATVLIAQSMIRELKALPPDRRRTFIHMVDEANRRLHRENEAVEFDSNFK